MSNKKILVIYKIAEKHWSRPSWLCWILGWNDTNKGLCCYFRRKHTESYYSNSFSYLWIDSRTKFCGCYHFYTRKERLQAIRNVIKDLENEQ